MKATSTALPPPVTVYAIKSAVAGVMTVLNPPVEERSHEPGKWNPSVELEEISNRLNRIFGRSPARAESGKETLAMADWAI